MMNKRGVLGLSVETLVVIIISMIILVGGISLLYKFIGGAEEIKADLDERTKVEIERIILDEGKQVVLPFHTATINRGENHVFGIGILNIRSADADGNPQTHFTLHVAPKTYIDLGGVTTDIDPYTDSSRTEQRWLLYNDRDMIIQENEHRTESILVAVPIDALIGQFIFDATVEDADHKLYGNVQKFYVTVK